MSTKRYRLLKDHPFAIAGKILKVIDQENGNFTLREESRTTIHMDIQVPQNAIGIWLEEVKEDVTFTKEQVEALLDVLDRRLPWAEFKAYLDSHTSTEE